MNLKFKIFSTIIIIGFLMACGDGGRNISKVELFPVSNGKVFQYIDRDGKIMINPQFSKATLFREDIALVRSSDDKPKWGFINTKGMYDINPQYKAATVFSEGLAWVISNNEAILGIDKKGDIKITLENAEQARIFKEGLAAYSIFSDKGEQAWGFVNYEGEVVINPQFSKVKDFNEGKCAVRNDESQWGYIDSEGIIIINYQFDIAESFFDNYAVVKLNKMAGVIDESGNYVINPQFSTMGYDGDLFLFEQNKKWGWCNREGEIIINAQFSAATPYNGNKLASVQSGDNWGFIDKEGKIVINPQFNAALPYNDNLALVSNGEMIGFIDQDGKYIINPQFKRTSSDLIKYLIDGSSKYESVNMKITRRW